jgi:hypothetical protein
VSKIQASYRLFMAPAWGTAVAATAQTASIWSARWNSGWSRASADQIVASHSTNGWSIAHGRCVHTRVAAYRDPEAPMTPRASSARRRSAKDFPPRRSAASPAKAGHYVVGGDSVRRSAGKGRRTAVLSRRTPVVRQATPLRARRTPSPAIEGRPRSSDRREPER